MPETVVNTTPSNSSTASPSRTVLLLMRVLTFVFLLIALILIATLKQTDADTEEQIKFSDFYGYRYMLATIIIGFAYNLLQMAFSIFTVVSGNRVLSGDGGYLFDFFADKMISYFMISGSAAGFGLTVELGRGVPSNSFIDKANAAASLLLIGFVFTAIASTITSFALPKKAN
ncbi:CASP-like protein 4D1 [Vigna radiata var. radiata]|uniref:CASP-like protein n=1 Tax=Vigna radiata var. radiata TaxID=3916 RepID=A0A1S3TT79_VIGRR|nr:CASP-like protein 4D1 [Vigna radiata var. radiata]